MRTLLFFMLFLASHAQADKFSSLKTRTLISNLKSKTYTLNRLNTFTQYHESHEILSEQFFLSLLRAAKNKQDCRELEALTNEELSEFYDKIVLIAQKNKMNSCAQNLSKRSKKYFNDKAKIISSKLRSQKYLTPCAEKVIAQRMLGPSKVYELPDSALGKMLVRDPMKKCEINFTFDDGPHALHTEEILQILKKENVTANFFLVGKTVKGHPELALKTLADGHVLGAHSQTHRELPKLPIEAAIEEIENSFIEIFEATGLTSVFFRFPYGATSPALKHYLFETQRFNFFWSMDSLDWKLKDPIALFDNVMTEIEREKRGIILFHDIHMQTVTVLPLVFQELKRAGYTPTLLVPEGINLDQK